MHKYHVRFLLHTYQATMQQVKSSLAEFGDRIDVLESAEDAHIRGRHFEISLYADEPTLVFDACAHFGRIKSVKVGEEKTEEDMPCPGC